ncbi:putative Mitochondrial carrier protein [Babesia divergens]|uniref:Mitochondrial carrier protein n=1 Tax=Babesia divergens TaxID=32595 RepID=A0AAD9LJZ9_BABDI|nr:putative Mitochondrial carrier protein [Babesia divergens]
MESDSNNHLTYEEWQGDCKFWQHAVCGSAAGVMEHLALFPLDTLKTRLQCGWCYCRKLAATPALDSLNGISTMSVPRSQLYQNLFRGCNVIAVGCIPAHIMYFSVYETMKKHGSVGVAGAMATLCHDVVLTPADVIKQRLQIGTYRDSLQCLRQIIQNEGVRSLYRSLSVTLFMNVPYHALLVTVNEFLMRMYPMKKDSNNMYAYFLYAGANRSFKFTPSHRITRNVHVDGVPLLLFVLCTALCIGGAAAGALTNPIDVIKTRLQTQGCKMGKNANSETLYSNPIEATKMVYRLHGFRGFWKGTTTRVGICIPAAAICWGTYATLKNLLVRFDRS